MEGEGEDCTGGERVADAGDVVIDFGGWVGIMNASPTC